MRKYLLTATCLVGAYAGYIALSSAPSNAFDTLNTAYSLSDIAPEAGPPETRTLDEPFDGTSLSGNYLSARFAQGRHDWEKARDLMHIVLSFDGDNIELIKRHMFLSMGSGEPKTAMAMAQKLNNTGEVDTGSLATLFLAINAFHDNRYQDASEIVEDMRYGSLSDFMKPIVQGWAGAAIGENLTDDLISGHSIHILHAILIADFLGRHEHIETILENAIANPMLTPEGRIKVADMYAHIGKDDQAIELYQDVLEILRDDPEVIAKIQDIRSGTKKQLIEKTSSADEGLSLAMFDMARLLYQEYSDETARVFANLALYLNPQLSDANLLMASINARNEKFDKAINYYRTIGPDHERYLEIRRETADLLEETNRIDEALSELKDIAASHQDLDALIQIGDIYRREKDFDKAVTYYNRAEAKLTDDARAPYWHLYYVRGMALEQAGRWPEAETDLQTALEFQPNHPFILNYLGYAWADQGVHLGEALTMIRKAVSLRPSDGYITDSLGWVMYRMGHYEQAIPHLERAVELLPYDPIINDHLGDAYWKVGRKLEARFQWTRAKNHAEDDTLINTILTKIDKGLETVDPEISVIKEASHNASSDDNDTQ